jgi:nuclear pore complex protein Nup188
LAGNSNEPSRDVVAEELQLRAEYLAKCTNPFPPPSKASRDKLQSGKLSLPLEGDFELDSAQISDILTLSDEFNIDEVETFVLYRALIFSYGERIDKDEKDTLLSGDELLNAFADFYFQERLAVLRIITILVCVRSDPEEWRYGIADVALSSIAPDPTSLVEALLAQVEAHSGPNPPSFAKAASRRSSKYAKQVLREQICQLELVFWLLWAWHQATPPPVLTIIKTACNTTLGAKQYLANFLLDDEGARLQRHFDILWTLIVITAFDLDHLTSPGNIILSDTPSPAYFDPKQVQELYNLIMPNVTDPQYTCLIMVWSIVLDQLGKAALAAGASLPSSYNSFLTTIIPDFDLTSSPRSESIALLLAHRAFTFDLVPRLQATLATSPLFHDHMALESPTVQPTPIVHRAAIKSMYTAWPLDYYPTDLAFPPAFIHGITKVFRVEYLPDVDSFIDLWVELFGAGNTNTSTVISLQFWQYDFPTPSGRALFDLTRTRFPVLIRPLVKLLRSMTGLGLSDLGVPLSQLTDENVEISRGECLKNVTMFMGKLSTYTMVLQQSGPMGFRTLWEVENDAYGETVYVNLKPFLLPGGSILAAKSHGKLISGGSGRPLIVRWEHEHSGWNLLLEILAGYIANRRGLAGATARIRGVEQASSMAVTKKYLKPVKFTLESIGMEQDDLEGQELLVTEILDLFHSVLKHRELSIVGEFLSFVEAQGLPQIGEGSAGYGMDLVQLTVQILEDALMRASQRHGSEHCTRVVISAISALSTLVNVTPGPTWGLLRSSKLFGSTQRGGYSSQGSSSVALATERMTGSYSVTIAILNLIRSLFDDAVRGCLSDRPHEVPAKEEVLLRAVRFMHVEIWVEFAGWKFAKLADRFEIGETIANLYHEILVNCTTQPPETVSIALLVALDITDRFHSRGSPNGYSPLYSTSYKTSS